MSAAEVIEIIEKLPLTEQQKVAAYLERKKQAATGDDVRRMDHAKAITIGEGIFDRHSELFRRLAQ
jgi:hypothetical protein